MSTYLLINLLIIVIPLLLSFDKKVSYYKKLLPVFISIFAVGLIYIGWDVLAVSRNDWSFNSDHVSGLNLINLPYEEILFFITVPYSVIFIYVCLKFYVKDKTYHYNRLAVSAMAAVFFISAFVLNDLNYTSTVLYFCSAIFVIMIILYKHNIITKVYLLTLVISFVPFFIFNYILTALPVVIYNPSAITNLRILSIPVEDFFYSFSMISCWLIVYISLINLKLKKANDQSTA